MSYDSPYVKYQECADVQAEDRLGGGWPGGVGSCLTRPEFPFGKVEQLSS